MKKILFSAILIFFTVNTFALVRPTIHLVHINGINTNFAKAAGNLAKLKDKIPINSNIVDWDLIYNPTNTGAVNMLQSIGDTFNQKAQEQQIVSIDDYVNSYMEANGLDYPLGSPEYEALKSQMASAYEAAFFSAAGNNFQAILSNFIERFPPPATNNYTNTTDYFLLIPHSQGNLYANDLWEMLTSIYHLPSDHIAIYGIASPASVNKGDWPVEILKNNIIPNAAVTLHQIMIM